MPLALRIASCECAATSSETIESRAVLSETDSPRLQRASCHRERAALEVVWQGAQGGKGARWV